jgi:hypothetical protein
VESKKRDVGAGKSAAVIERARSLVLSNGIESIAKSEQTSRMMIIECDKDLYGSDYTSAMLLEIQRQRDVLLSAIFHITQRVLTRIDKGDWQAVQEKLQRDYKDHPKSRMFEHLALMILCLEEHFRATGKDVKDVWQLTDRWMISQRESALEEIVTTDPIIEALDLIRDAALKQERYDSTHHAENTAGEMERNRIIKLDVNSLPAEVTVSGGFKIKGTSGNLRASFALAMKSRGSRDFTIHTSRVLSQRIAAVEKELRIHGYELSKEDDSHLKQLVYTLVWDSEKKQPN